MCELSGSGGTTSVVATNTFEINGLVSRNDSSGTNFYAFDPQGSTAERVDSSGTLVSSDCYNAWGTASTTASAAVVFGYIAQWGYYTDAETGLVLCTHRYYDPAHGRWLTRDPIGYAGGINVYSYCEDEPVGLIDPTGTCCIPNPLLSSIIRVAVGTLITAVTIAILATVPEAAVLEVAITACLWAAVASIADNVIQMEANCKPVSVMDALTDALVTCVIAAAGGVLGTTIVKNLPKPE